MVLSIKLTILISYFHSFNPFIDINEIGTLAAIFYNSMGSRQPWFTSKRVKGSDRRAFILILDLILVYATLIVWINFSQYPNLFKSENIKSTLTLFRMGFFGAVHGWGVGGGGVVVELSHISYSDETWHSWHSYTLPKDDPKNIWILWQTPWVLPTSAFFQRKPANFVISRNTDIDCILIHNF